MSNVRVLSDWMQANEDILEWVEPHGGVMCFPRYRANMSSIELCHKLLDDHGVMVNPGEYFNLDGHIRLGYACSEDILRSGLDALGTGLRKLA